MLDNQDSLTHEDCYFAPELAAQGLCKSDCQHWRPRESIVSVQRMEQRNMAARAAVRKEADTRRSNSCQAALALDIALASSAPQFVGSGFGHGYYVRAGQSSNKG